MNSIDDGTFAKLTPTGKAVTPFKLLASSQQKSKENSASSRFDNESVQTHKSRFLQKAARNTVHG
jgi:hypothetical protein